MKFQRCYNGVRFLNGAGPSMRNIAKLDAGAVPMIHKMAETGLQVDISHFEAMDKLLTIEMERVTEKVQQLTGTSVQLGSAPQVAHLLFKEIGLKKPKEKLTPSGDRETVDKDALISIQHQHEVVPQILQFRTLDKLRGTYVRPIPKLAKRKKSGQWRVYPNWKTTRVPSGRLACEEPNLLAMPNRTKLGRKVCEGYIAEDGYVLLSVDESQIEPRAVAHRSGDQNLKAIYENKEDIYSDFATAAFHIPDQRFKNAEGKWEYPGVDGKLHRFPSKTCILSAIYDVSAGGLLEKMPVMCANCLKPALEHDCGSFKTLWTEDKCQQILSDFYLRYPRILDMRRVDHARARRFGYIWDDWGRLLHTTAVRSVLKWVVSAALRELGNFPVQSLAQGTIKLAMAAAHDDFEQSGLYQSDIVRPLLQIHDELLLEVKEEWAEEVAAMIEYRFENCVRLDVPITAGHASAPNWGVLVK